MTLIETLNITILYQVKKTLWFVLATTQFKIHVLHGNGSSSVLNALNSLLVGTHYLKLRNFAVIQIIYHKR